MDGFQGGSRNAIRCAWTAESIETLARSVCQLVGALVSGDLGYTPHDDGKSAETPHSKGVSAFPWRKRVRKWLIPKWLNGISRRGDQKEKWQQRCHIPEYA